MSRTLVDSAPAGTHCDVSFFSAPVSFADSGNVITSTTTLKPTTTHLVQLPAGISAIFPSLPISSPGSAGGHHRSSRRRPQDQLSGWSGPAPSSRPLCPVAAVPASGPVRWIQMRTARRLLVTVPSAVHHASFWRRFNHHGGVQRECTVVQRRAEDRPLGQGSQVIGTRGRGVGALPARADGGREVLPGDGLARARLAIAARIARITFSLPRSACEAARRSRLSTSPLAHWLITQRHRGYLNRRSVRSQSALVPNMAQW